MKATYKGHSNKSGIYQIVNLQNRRFYYGSCKCFKVRANQHLKSLQRGTHHNKFLQNDFNKCGETAFEFIVVEVVENDRLLVEQKYLNLFHDDQQNCYNFDKKANGSERSCSSKTPEETSELISENMKRIWSDPEMREKRMKTFQSEEFKKQQSENQKRVANDPQNKNSAAANKARYENINERKKHAEIMKELWSGEKGKQRKEKLSKKLKEAWSADNGSRKEKASECGKKYQKLNKEKMIENSVKARTKYYGKLISPDGKIYEVHNAKKFCEEHGIKYYTRIWELFSGRTSSYKGWKVYID